MEPNSNSPCSSIVQHIGSYVGGFFNRNWTCIQFDSEASWVSYIIPIYDSRTLDLPSNKQIMIPSPLSLDLPMEGIVPEVLGSIFKT